MLPVKCYMFWCCCLVTQSCLTLCDPMDCITPGFPVLHYLLEFAQTHVHWVNDAIQPSHPPLPPSPSSLDLTQHQGIFQWVGSSHQVVKVSELQHQFTMTIQGWFPLGLTGFISLLFVFQIKDVFSSIKSKYLCQFSSSTYPAHLWHSYYLLGFILWSFLLNANGVYRCLDLLSHIITKTCVHIFFFKCIIDKIRCQWMNISFCHLEVT